MLGKHPEDPFRPKTYKNNNLTWNGKRLTSYGTNTYKYNSEGIRISKTTSEGEYKYLLDGNKIIKEIKPTNKEIYYHYNEKEELVGFNYNTKEYFYIRDITGNITNIIDSNGTIKVSYEYDAWGKVINIDGDEDLIEINSYLYKGYYYDKETQLFWVSSRYYSPELCRWISPDDIEYLDPESVNGLNLYVYCGNDPINKYDPTGHSAILIGLIIGAVIGAAVGFGTAAYIDYQDDGQVFNGSVAWYDYLGATILGGAIGAGIGAGIGYIAPQIGSALSSFAAQQFTFGAGTYLTASGELAMTAGLTITGAQILQGAGILSGITIMASIIGKSGGYTVKKFPNDHDPTHVHIFGDDIADKAHSIRIGLDGNPLPGQGKLPPGARKALKKLWELILKALSK